jgi:hypothetical protein
MDSLTHAASRCLLIRFASDHCAWKAGSVARGLSVSSRRRLLTHPGPRIAVKMLDSAGFA